MTERSPSPSHADAPDEGGAPLRPSRSREVGRLLAGLVVFVTLFLLRERVAAGLPRFVDWVRGLGPLGAFGFVAAYVVAAVAFVPGSVLSMAGGAIFGFLRGVVLVFAGASLGAIAAFSVARWLARGAIERRLVASPRFSALDRAVAAEGLKIAFLLRLSPVVPFNLLNYSLGLTRIRPRDYVLATTGMIPSTLLYVYYGKVGADLARLVGPARVVDRGPEYYVFLALGLAATITATTLITRVARRALRGHLDA